MSDTIVCMPGIVPTFKHEEPNADVIEMLERVLQEAREGRWHSVAVLAIGGGDSIVDEAVLDNLTRLQMSGLALALQQMLTSQWMGAARVCSPCEGA